MSALRIAYMNGVKAAAAHFKIALGPPTQVDQFMADVESGKDIPPTDVPPMSSPPDSQRPALDGTIPLSTSPPTPADTIGSTIGTPPDPATLAGSPAMPYPSMGGLTS
jgi:hypothetical protein